MQFTFAEPDPERLCKMRTLYVQELFRAGMLSANGILSPSYAHNDEVLEAALAIVGGALEAVARAEREDDFDRRIEIPPAMFFSTDEYFR